MKYLVMIVRNIQTQLEEFEMVTGIFYTKENEQFIEDYKKTMNKAYEKFPKVKLEFVLRELTNEEKSILI